MVVEKPKETPLESLVGAARRREGERRSSADDKAWFAANPRETIRLRRHIPYELVYDLEPLTIDQSWFVVVVRLSATQGPGITFAAVKQEVCLQNVVGRNYATDATKVELQELVCSLFSREERRGFERVRALSATTNLEPDRLDDHRAGKVRAGRHARA